MTRQELLDRLERIKDGMDMEFQNKQSKYFKEMIEDFMNLKCKKIILKRPLKFRKNYSNINYQVLGKTTRFDIYL